MIEKDIVIAGCGIAGLLLGSELSGECDVLLLEQRGEIPHHKYWLTSQRSAEENPELKHCIDSIYDSMDFIAYDETTARTSGPYPLWDTGKLIGHLTARVLERGANISTDRRFYTYRRDGGKLILRAGTDQIACRIFIDCMGYGSPLLTAKNVVQMLGYFVLTGGTFEARGKIRPVGLHNMMLQANPRFLELFPSSDGKAHLVIIEPCRTVGASRGLAQELEYTVRKSHYSQFLGARDAQSPRLFGIVPVGRLRRRSLDNIFFYGEAGQVNPATSATGLTRMLYTYKAVARHLLECLRQDRLNARALEPKTIPFMSDMNRFFQEALFQRILSSNSDGFRKLVREMAHFGDEVSNDLIFAEHVFTPGKTLELLVEMARRPSGLLGACGSKALWRKVFGV